MISVNTKEDIDSVISENRKTLLGIQLFRKINSELLDRLCLTFDQIDFAQLDNGEILIAIWKYNQAEIRIILGKKKHSCTFYGSLLSDPGYCSFHKFATVKHFEYLIERFLNDSTKY